MFIEIIIFCLLRGSCPERWDDESILSERQHNFFKNYLSGRTQAVKLNGTRSTSRMIQTGVPQGSILALIMFVVYMNDMPKGISAYFNLFADDANTMKQIKSEATEGGIFHPTLRSQRVFPAGLALHEIKISHWFLIQQILEINESLTLNAFWIIHWDRISIITNWT